MSSPNLAGGTPTLPAALVRNVGLVWGDAGRRWLTELPEHLARIAATWQLRLGAPYDLSYHWVGRAERADGTPVVLKVGLPGAEHLAVEAAALRVFDGRGAVRLLAYDAAAGALLLERAEPGTMVRSLLPGGDEAATAAAVSVLHRLHLPLFDGDGGLPPAAARVDDLTAYLARHPGEGPLSRHLVTTAAGLFAELSASATERVALHGDLHHDNVLAAHREPWLAIDPHGLVGDPCYDVGSWMYNPDPGRLDPALTALVPARCEQFADGLGQPLDRVVAYAFVVAVLSEVWTVEDGGPPDGQPLAVARLLLPRLS